MNKKIIINIILGFVSLIILLLSLVLIFIEGRLLFSGDWLVYDNVVLGFFRYFFRLNIALFALGHSVLTFINFKKKNSTLKYYLLLGNFALLIASIFLIFTGSNMVGEIAFMIAIFPIMIKVIDL